MTEAEEIVRLKGEIERLRRALDIKRISALPVIRFSHII